MNWALTTISCEAVSGGWEAEAMRLRSRLDVITRCFEAEHSERLTWRSEVMSALQWEDMAAIAAEMQRGQLSDENDPPSLLPEVGASGAVQAYRGQLPAGFAASLWRVGGHADVQFHHNIEFHSGDPERGSARELNEYSVTWLAHLLTESAFVVGANEARITFGLLDDELADAREEAAWFIGALTLFPNGIGGAEVPDEITAIPCTSGYPNGLVLAANPERAVHDFESLVPSLLAVHDIYQTMHDVPEKQSDEQ